MLYTKDAVLNWGKATLFGGPAHDMKIFWQGGDTILIPVAKGGYGLAGMHAPPTQVGTPTAMYVRSRRNPEVYVHQPE